MIIKPQYACHQFWTIYNIFKLNCVELDFFSEFNTYVTGC